LAACSSGDIAKFESQLKALGSAQPSLSKNADFLGLKIRVMALLSLVFRRGGGASGTTGGSGGSSVAAPVASSSSAAAAAKSSSSSSSPLAAAAGESQSLSRTIPLAEIATSCQLGLDKVEMLLMKSFSLKLMTGHIDEVSKVVHIHSVQPRILELGQIQLLRTRIKQWSGTVNKTASFLHEHAQQLVTAS